MTPKYNLAVAALVAGLGAAAPAGAAISVADLQKIVDPSRFAFSLDGRAISSYGIRINGGTPLPATIGNLPAIATALAANASIELATKTIGGQTFSNVPIVTLNNDVRVEIGSYALTLNGPRLNNVVAELTFEDGLRLDPDPVINFPFSVLNTSNATRTFSFTTPLLINPVLTPAIAPDTRVKSSLTGTLTDRNNNGVSISPSTGGTIVSTTLFDGITPVSMGVNVGNAQSFAADPDPEADVFSYVGQFNPGPGAGPFADGPTATTGYTAMIQFVSFTLSPGDRATMVAFSEIQPIPEPSTWALMAGGLLGVAAAARRRRARA